jgi:hypothetical protein
MVKLSELLTYLSTTKRVARKRSVDTQVLALFWGGGGHVNISNQDRFRDTLHQVIRSGNW